MSKMLLTAFILLSTSTAFATPQKVSLDFSDDGVKCVGVGEKTCSCIATELESFKREFYSQKTNVLDIADGRNRISNACNVEFISPIGR